MKYILVTGAYGGMGKETVNALKNKGFCVFAMDKVTQEPQDNIIPITADITDPKSIQAAFLKISSVTNELHAILHFTGIYMLDSLVEIESCNFEQAFKVNLFGAYEVNKTFLPLIKKGGRIIITTSELAPLDPLPFTGLYAVTKGALDKYAYSLRMELQLLGISVSVLRAGAVNTGMLGVSTAALERFCQNTKLYSCNASRFKTIVDKVEARNIPPQKLAQKALKILLAKSPKFAYSINRNPLLLLFNILPKAMQFFILKLILKG